MLRYNFLGSLLGLILIFSTACNTYMRATKGKVKKERFTKNIALAKTTNLPSDKCAGLPIEFISNKKLKIKKRNDGKAIPERTLPCDCHIQGIGWASESHQIVLTCQDKCSQKKGAYLMLYDKDSLLPLDVKKGKAKVFFNHPSAIQIANNIFPVAMAAGKKEDTHIEFYKIKSNQLKHLKGSGIHLKGKHIGALGYATIRKTTYLVGVGWNAKDLTIWKSPNEQAYSKFEEHFYTSDATSLIQSTEKPYWGPYNSLWLGSLADGRDILISTHGKAYEKRSYMEIWEIKNIESKQPSLELLTAKNIKGKTINGLNYFYEGVTVKLENNNLNDVSLLAAPYDFTSLNCPAGYRCSNAIYELKFVK